MKKKREENVELADIQAVRERMTQWAIRLWLLLIPVIVGIILSTQGESTAAGQKQQAQDRSQQHKKQVPDFFHDDPPGLKLKKLHDKRSDTSLPWSSRVS